MAGCNVFLNFTVEIIHYMLRIGGFFGFEHPIGASSWKVHCRGVTAFTQHKKSPISSVPLLIESANQ